MSDKQKIRLSRAVAVAGAVAGVGVTKSWVTTTASLLKVRMLKFWFPESFGPT
jgi:hypothetical protein